MIREALVASVLAVLACRPTSGPADAASASPEVRYRPVFEPPGPEAVLALRAVPDSRWDDGLARIARELVARCSDRSCALDAVVVSQLAARVGFPGQVRVARVLNGGAFPDRLLADLAEQTGGRPADLALAQRTWGDGISLWIVAWAPHVLDLDPIPRDLALDAPLPVRVDGDSQDARLFVAPPDRPVEEMTVTPGTARWVDRFHSPGEYRIEVVAQRDGHTEVAHLFSVFVDATATDAGPLGTLPPAPDPSAAERDLYAALDALRTAHGLRPVQRFETFEPIAREHASLMAARGVVGHAIAGVTDGVPARAFEQFHPQARHFENVAAAASAAEALALVERSPGHLQNLLCESCTHASIGAALEPVLDRPPRLFVSWELLEFPEGPPKPIDHYNR